MQTKNLPSPGNLAMGIKLRTEAAKAISFCEVVAGKMPGGQTNTAGQLAQFFTFCAASLSGLYEAVAPTVSSRVVADEAPDVIVVTFNEAMDQGVVPAGSAFTIAGTDAGGRTVTSVAYTSPTTLALTLSAPLEFEDVITLSYTSPAVNRLRDFSGNPLANFTTQAVTNDVEEPEEE